MHGWLALALLLLTARPAPLPGQEARKEKSVAASAKSDRSGSAKAKHDTKDAPAVPQERGEGASRGGHRGEGDKEQSAYDFGLPAADGKNLPLSDLKGKVLLIVNLGRQSSYNSQLSGLQQLYDTYKDKGLVILGVPSNDFGAAEPGTQPEVAKYYADQKITFPVMQVSTLTGVHELPLFSYLSKSKSVQNDGLHWNFTKFIVDRKGKVIVCLDPDVAPDSLAMKATLEEVLDGTWKPKKPNEGRGRGQGEDGPE